MHLPKPATTQSIAQPSRHRQQPQTPLTKGLWPALLLPALLSSAAMAEELPISNTPLFLASSVAPNVFFEVDDSGSMDWEILTQPHWSFCAYDLRHTEEAYNIPPDEDCGQRVSNGLWRTYHPDADDGGGGGGFFSEQKNFIFANTDNLATPSCANTLESCDAEFVDNLAYQLDWRIFSASFNKLAYNPAAEYTPWAGPCLSDGSRCDAAAFDAARSDPRQGSDGYGLTRDLDGFVFEIWSDDKGYSGDRPRRGVNSNSTSGANGEVDIWDTHTRYVIDGNQILVTTTSYNPAAPTVDDPSGLHPQAVTRTLSGSGCFAELYPGGAGQCRSIAQTRQNIANWYQYYRKRSYVAKGAIASVVSSNSNNRYGLSVINNFNQLFVEVPAIDAASLQDHNHNLLASLFAMDWPNSGTPLRPGLQRVGDYFDNAMPNYADPIVGVCQKNFAVLFTDGYWNGGGPTGIQDVDGDGVAATLADVARHYYNRDLSPLANQVPADDFDTNRQQHMVTFTVAYGVRGNLTDTDTPPDGWPDDAGGNNLTESSNWGNPTSGGDTPAKIDDLWHAAYNSRGSYVTASTASDVVEALQSALENIDRRISSGSSVALNSGMISDSTTIYQARFDSVDWTGELNAIALDPQTGLPGDTVWPDGETLPGWQQRQILTHNGNQVANDGAAFRWDELSPLLQQQLSRRASGSDAEIEQLAQDRLDHLRGDASNEQRNGGTLRNRERSVFGDIINSAPAYVGKPAFNYPDALEGDDDAARYGNFYEEHLDRSPMVYVGANDGMLHGFDARTGVETLAYVPRAVYRNLYLLTNPNYSHNYYVDGSPTVGDAYFDPDTAQGSNPAWHTVLVGGLNKGGQGVYALDITDPQRFSENNTDTVLWEFTDADDHDIDGDGDNDPLPTEASPDPEDSMRHALGDSYSRPAVIRLHNGQWAAVFGNGYNNDYPDRNSSNNGDAVLYIVDIGTGAVIRKISTRTGKAEDPAAYRNNDGVIVSRERANGLATTAPVDVDGDHTVDYVYAGDLFGNLWKFDLRSSNPAEWRSYYTDGSGNPRPLFTACAGTCAEQLNDNHQPITIRPEVGRAPDRRSLMIFFGTGKYLAGRDVSDTSLQTFYGIIDDGVTPLAGRDELLRQTIVFEGIQTFDATQAEVRVTSNTPLTTQRGWYLDLDSPNNNRTEGERVVQTPLLRSGRIIFPTLIPDADICGLGGRSWLMELSAFTGSRLTVTPFDLSGDNRFDDTDTVTISDASGNPQRAPASGIKQNEIISSPSVINAEDRELKVTSGSSGNVLVTVESPPAESVNRQSWRQLR